MTFQEVEELVLDLIDGQPFGHDPPEWRPTNQSIHLMTLEEVAQRVAITYLSVINQLPVIIHLMTFQEVEELALAPIDGQPFAMGLQIEARQSINSPDDPLGGSAAGGNQ
jgi:hypothetical protein